MSVFYELYSLCFDLSKNLDVIFAVRNQSFRTRQITVSDFGSELAFVSTSTSTSTIETVPTRERHIPRCFLSSPPSSGYGLHCSGNSSSLRLQCSLRARFRSILRTLWMGIAVLRGRGDNRRNVDTMMGLSRSSGCVRRSISRRCYLMCSCLTMPLIAYHR